jgi:hypothetical protein
MAATNTTNHEMNISATAEMQGKQEKRAQEEHVIRSLTLAGVADVAVGRQTQASARALRTAD